MNYISFLADEKGLRVETQFTSSKDARPCYLSFVQEIARRVFVSVNCNDIEFKRITERVVAFVLSDSIKTAILGDTVRGNYLDGKILFVNEDGSENAIDYGKLLALFIYNLGLSIGGTREAFAILDEAIGRVCGSYTSYGAMVCTRSSEPFDWYSNNNSTTSRNTEDFHKSIGESVAEAIRSVKEEYDNSKNIFGDMSKFNTDINNGSTSNTLKSKGSLLDSKRKAYKGVDGSNVAQLISKIGCVEEVGVSIKNGKVVVDGSLTELEAKGLLCSIAGIVCNNVGVEKFPSVMNDCLKSLGIYLGEVRGKTDSLFDYQFLDNKPSKGIKK